MCFACRGHPVRAAMAGTKFWCISSTTGIAPATSSRSCRGSTSTCAARRPKALLSSAAPLPSLRPLGLHGSRSDGADVTALKRIGPPERARPTRRCARSASLLVQFEVPRLGAELLAEHVVGPLIRQFKTGSLVDAAGGGEHGVGP